MNDVVGSKMVELDAVEVRAVVGGAGRSKGFGVVADAKPVVLKEDLAKLVKPTPDGRKLYVGNL